ncbi:RICIN domain-containing protein [Streptomyces sp. R11]|uniref:RICIN domain-containing protein n=1 Tax=Streptomyces sp. R11 TaxID=3238625 RepID=A0AB39NFS1_9ACTN
MPSQRFFRRAGAGLATAAAVVSATVTMITPASAGSIGNVALIPSVAPKVNVALGAEFPLAQRNSAAFDPAERWDMVEKVPLGGLFVLRNLHKVDGKFVCMDSQAPGQGLPKAGDAVGTRPCDGTNSQLWIRKNNSDKTITLTNAYSKYVLSWAGTGAVPAYEQKVPNQTLVFPNFRLIVNP